MVRKSTWVLGGLALIALGVIGCDIGKACTDIGCQNVVIVTAAPKVGSWQTGMYALELDLDDKHVSCSFAAPDDVPTAGSHSYAACTGDFKVDFSGYSDHIELRRPLTDDRLPKTAHVALSRDGASVLDESQTLTYHDNQPNPDCAPVCHGTEADFIAD